MSKRTTKTHRSEDGRQASLLEVAPVEVVRPVERIHFDRGDRGGLFFGGKRVDQYLTDEGQGWVVRLADFLEELEWGDFERAYEKPGRPPLHPSRVVGLVIYAAMLGQTSLRQMEALSARDFGALWMTGGLKPDSTTLCRFMQRHQALLSEDFFTKTAWAITKRLRIKKGELAIDGTIVQAVSSTTKSLKRAALDAALTKAAAEGEEKKLRWLQAASTELASRQAVRDAASKPGEVSVVPHEPEAVLLPQKNSRDFAHSYTPVVATHESGLIVGQCVVGAGEAACVPSLLAQHQDVFGAQPERLLADAGFHSIATLAFLVAHNIDCLIPSGTAGDSRSRKQGLFTGADFVVGEDGQPVCPAGTPMQRKQRGCDAKGRGYVTFRGVGCATCPLRARCIASPTTSARSFKLYDGHEFKRAMDEVMCHPMAQRAYRRRAPIVETSFARLKHHGLRRFRRRGLAGVRLEFALAAMGHNFRLFVARAGGVSFVFLAVHLDGTWTSAALLTQRG